MESRLLRAHRVVGAVVDSDAASAVSFYSLGGEGFVCARASYDAFHVIKLEELTVQVTSPRLGRQIDALVAVGEWTYVAHGRELWAFERARSRGRVGAAVETPIEALVAVGDSIVAKCGAREGASLVVVWTCPSRGEPSRLASEFWLDGFVASVVTHPPAYINKLLFGSSRSGGLELWNARSRKRVHRFACAAGRAGVVVLEPSGVLDVVGVGRADGAIELVHARRDEVLFELSQKKTAPTCLFFVSGGVGSESRALLVSGGADGTLRVWDLESRRLVHEELSAHGGPAWRGFAGGVGGSPTSAASIVATTVGGDNAIAQWTFEAADGSCRLARKREGHAAPPHAARWYYGSSSSSSDPYGALQLVTCSREDRSVRVAHAARDQLNTEISQGPLAKRAKTLRLPIRELRLPPVVAIATCDAKDGAWASVVTCHEGQATARCWHFSRRVISDVSLAQPQWRNEASSLSAAASEDDADKRATACALSACGNFAVVGHADGRARKYNVQSGRPRGEYPANLETAAFEAKRAASVAVPGSVTRAARDIDRKMRKGERIDAALDAKAKRRVVGADGLRAHRRGAAGARRHRGAITGLFVDAENAFVATAGLDGSLKWWDFRRHFLVAVVDCGQPVARIEGARSANLIAVACDDGVIRLVEATPRSRENDPRPRVARRLSCGDARPPRDLSWAPDFKTLYAACGDGSLRVWDVSSGALVDWLAFEREATSVSASPTGEFVATTHVAERGIVLWTDKASYCRVDARPLTDADEPILVDVLDGPELIKERPKDDDETGRASRLEGLAAHVLEANAARRAVRLSGHPRSRLETMHALEAISERNKPVEPPKKNEAAPFFLPSALGPADLQPQDKHPPHGPKRPPDTDAPGTNKRRRAASFEAARRCQLATFALSPKPDALVEYLKSLNPPAVDAEIALLCRGAHDDPGLGLLVAVLEHLAVVLETRDVFDEVQAYLHRIIQHHASALALPELRDKVRLLHKAQRAAAAHLRSSFQESLCLVDFYLSRTYE
ncbi:hypothetical protein CTAYLR_000175 [Chrysophaeum taylorii]|uniref:Small-subunit processome Utp21 domain-containing protein n=1 Tax=Chrysophaeum taylorii TaxID=2483200 RepID=A0AAD7XM25_9STRA|nr:hypothetical protein CTAYLR_000175 [Chrysophaeum taylorii]